ncbi:MBL fold metallo-hydrolase [Gloeocapsopsis crepidinum LEGE 06123]|uniref:MBL fold metallo-hydrolase n=1 Tax=Gloeocapsopsis crepidinum LEGE 06123 TaxID=588587 RepID=A0ABR9UWT4_9CHRO|nr:MBL fold metallo-hydrolase [Gloeocapsopsis crepidinum]MBE9192741.1 MBL fold metallo-hydrolase [Gloeocapsopsis crepidinum LEGE 06123]
MKRRQLMQYAGAGLLTTMATTLVKFQSAVAQEGSLSVRWLGHTCFLFTGGGTRVLVNPFQTLGCTAGYRPPNIEADLVLISSQLLDEGAVAAVPGNPRLIYEPGVYEFNDIQFQGIATDHDRVGGRRFGTNVAWRWTQAGINILHLGGAAAPITIEQKILMGTPDVVMVPVGGGAKAYNPQEAQAAVKMLNPKLVIPTHYRTQAADEASCDIVALDDFLAVMDGMPVRRSNSDSVTIRAADLPQNGSAIQVLSYQF